ncbi:MAG: hypothetical protein KGM47_18930, partial [Acidobacteriota bacterium]|nr:hypothetical protein [Acidobacteriota bacterium]
MAGYRIEAFQSSLLPSASDAPKLSGIDDMLANTFGCKKIEGKKVLTGGGRRKWASEITSSSAKILPGGLQNFAGSQFRTRVKR